MSADETRIRAATGADFDAIAAIINPYILKTGIHFGTEPVSGAELRAGWEAHRGYPYLVVVEDGAEGAGTNGREAVVGLAKLGPWRERAAYARSAETGIYVREDRHGRGLGRRLYEALIAEARAAGYHLLVAGVALPNEGSCRLHERVGFVPTGVFPEAGWKFGKWWDVAFYHMVLREGSGAEARAELKPQGGTCGGGGWRRIDSGIGGVYRCGSELEVAAELIMKNDIHPTYYHNCKVYHNGQVVMTTGATVPEMHVEVWSGSHPFFTGKQTFVDTTGRVERFQKKFQGNYFKPEAKKAAPVPAKNAAAVLGSDKAKAEGEKKA